MWSIHHVISFRKEDLLRGAYTQEGDAFLGLHGGSGMRLLLGPKTNWIGCFDLRAGSLAWSAGPKTKSSGSVHIPADLKRPSWVAPRDDGAFLVCNAGRNQIGVLDTKRRSFTDFIDLKPYGVSSPANSVFDASGNIWVNDAGRRALWVFTHAGKLLRLLGDPDAAVQRGSLAPSARQADPALPAELPLEDMRLGEVYDIRCGTDGLLYILEGSLLRLRAVDFQRNSVTCVAGTGRHGCTGDGGDPRRATFGRTLSRQWNGPWAFCIDERNRIFISDTQNRAIRLIDRDRTCITTIAGGRAVKVGQRNEPGETDPLKLLLPSVCWMDWSDGLLSVSDQIGDLVVLRESARRVDRVRPFGGTKERRGPPTAAG